MPSSFREILQGKQNLTRWPNIYKYLFDIGMGNIFYSNNTFFYLEESSHTALSSEKKIIILKH